MSDTNLRNEVLKLARDNKELRPMLLPLVQKRASSISSIADGIIEANLMLAQALHRKLKQERGDLFDSLGAPQYIRPYGGGFEGKFANQLDQEKGFLLLKIDWGIRPGRATFLCVMSWGHRVAPLTKEHDFDIDLNESKFLDRVWPWLVRELDSFVLAVADTYNR